MEMQVTQLVAVGTIVDLLRVESLLHGTRHLSHVGHEVVALLVGQLVQVVHMSVIGHEAAPAVGLLLEEEHTRDTQLRELDHQVVKGLVVGAVKALFGIAVHNDFVFELIVIK